MAAPAVNSTPPLDQTRRGIWIGHTAAAVYVLSMFLVALYMHEGPSPSPGNGDRILGFFAALFCFQGLGNLLSPGGDLGVGILCAFGTAANVLFVINYVLFVRRCRRGTTGYSAGVAALAIAGVVAPWLFRLWLLLMPPPGDLEIGFYVWCAAPIILAVGTWRLRAPGQAQAHGFEVVIREDAQTH